MNKECIFCNIINKKSDSYIVYENELVMAILDIDPINEGHILLITKTHYLDLDEISEDEIKTIFVCVKKIIKALKKVYKLDGYSIMQNGGKFNEIGHFHLHIFPRYYSDGFTWKYSDNKYLVSKEISEEIKRALMTITD